MTADWLKELWSYRELFYFLVWRDVKVKYKQSLLGMGWAVIQPLFAMIIFSLFFGRFAQVPSDGIPYPVFVYSALVVWTYFASAVAFSATSLVMNTNLITKVYFPRVALPFASVFSGLVDVGVASVLLLALMAYYGIAITWWLLLSPLFVFSLVVLAAGVGMILASLNVRYRDVKYVVPFGIQLWLFVSPVIYPVSIVPEQYRPLLALNPVTGIVDGFRACVFPTRHFDWQLIGMSLLVTLLVFTGGAVYFRRTERWFADII